MYNDNTYFTGNTVRLKATFKDFDGILIDPTIIKVIIYDYKYQKISEYVPIKTGVGTYILNYTTPQEEQRIIYEWYSEIQGSPSLKRGSFKISFMGG